MSAAHPTHAEAHAALEKLIKHGVDLEANPKHDDPDIVLLNYITDHEDAEKRRKRGPTLPRTFA